MERTPIPDGNVDMEDEVGHGGKKARRGAERSVMTFEQLEVMIQRSMDAAGTKPEELLSLIQRC